jgi:hypothetical protein
VDLSREHLAADDRGMDMTSALLMFSGIALAGLALLTALSGD